MNCNPFTLGHKHLIEIATKIVDYLYIFVVSEDKSAFSFEERIKMVKAGTEEYSNCCVLPSGNFILSKQTFPEYFEKDEKTDVVVDMSDDVKIFGAVISKTLNISIRFLGQEPKDLITNQYNRTLEMLLPKYGIKVIEIPRKKISNQVISASVVRKLLSEGKLEEAAHIVPETTMRVLREIEA